MSDPFVLHREATAEPFVATIGDVTLTFTHIGSLDQFALAELFSKDDLTNTEFIVSVLSLGLDAEGLEKLRALRLTGKEMAALWAAYQLHGGTSEGESPASSA